MIWIHRMVGYAVPAAFALLTLWVVVSLVRNRHPGQPFWHLLATAQVVIGIQVLVGLVLFLAGGRPASNGPRWLHYLYGGVFPAVVLIVAHRFGRRRPDAAWLVFGVASFVNFGLTFRALQTGLGID